MNPVVHFEMPAKDKARAKTFYESAFGWEMKQLDADMGGYMVATTVQTDENRMPKHPGAINGGFFDYADKEGFREPHLVMSVENLEASIEKVKAAGGTILGGSNPNKQSPEEPDDIPGIGRHVSFRDSEDNLVGMLEPVPRQAQ